MTVKLQSKTTVRGIGTVEIFYIQQTRSSGVYEIILSYRIGDSPASQWADTLVEATKIAAEYNMDLILRKQQWESI